MRYSDIREDDRFHGSTFIDDDDGHKYSVEQAYRVAKANPKYLRTMPIADLAHDLEWWEAGTQDGSQSHEHMQTVDTKYPLLVLEQPDGQLSVADGLNRLKKARDIENSTMIAAYVLPWTDTLKRLCRIDPT